ncbi:MAG: hypothetical protein AABW50_02800 [Nanoarchaeota archaeon]
MRNNLVKDRGAFVIPGLNSTTGIVRVTGVLVLLFGMALIANSFFGITGFSVGGGVNDNAGSILGLVLEAVGGALILIRIEKSD